MKALKAKIRKTSPHFERGLNQKGKPVWLSITGFKPQGTKNFKPCLFESAKRNKTGSLKTVIPAMAMTDSLKIGEGIVFSPPPVFMQYVFIYLTPSLSPHGILFFQWPFLPLFLNRTDNQCLSAFGAPPVTMFFNLR